MPLSAIDLFCGAGGFSLGLEQAGIRVKLAIDNWQPALDTHLANMPECEVVCMDILELDPASLPKVDVVVGSPPCPAFSSANRKRDPAKGMILVNRFFEIVRHLKPRCFVMENVPPVLDHIRIGGVRKLVLNSADFGVPHIRHRAFVGKYPIPTPTHASHELNRLDGSPIRKWVTVREALGIPHVIADTNANGSNYRQPREMASTVVAGGHAMGGLMAPLGTVPFAHRRDWKNRPKVPRSIDRPSYALDTNGIAMAEEPKRARTYGVDERRRVTDIDRPARTVMVGGGVGNAGGGRPPSIPVDGSLTRRQAERAGKGGRLDPVVVDPGAPAITVIGNGTSANLKPLVVAEEMGYRRLSVLECGTLMGFPDTFVWTGSKTSQYKQCGNAVCPPVSFAIAKAILEETRRR